MRRWLALAVAVGAASVLTWRPTYDPDLFWHLAQGRAVLAGHIVRSNLFSASWANYPQPYTSWAFEAMTAASARLAGFGGIEAVQFGLLAAAFLMLYASARVRSSPRAALSVLLLSLFVIEPRAMTRPYLVSFIGLSACAYVIERWSVVRIPRAMPIVLIVLLWANFHSEAVFGAGMIGLFGLCELVRPSVLSRTMSTRALGISGVAFISTLATPYGLGLWRYLYENLSVPGTLRIAELLPPSPAGYPAFFAYLAVLAALLASAPKRLRLWEAAVAVFFAALGLRFIRFTPMVVFATAPMLAGRIDRLVEKGWDRRAVLATVLAVMVVTAPASPQRMFDAWRTGADAVAPPDVFSEDAVAFAREHELTGPMFNSMNLGGYLAWTIPGARVFQDSRLQAYPPAYFKAILDASRSPERWHALVSGVDWAITSLARPNELSGVGQFPPEEWAAVFKDRAVEILVRRTGRYAALVQPLEIPRTGRPATSR